MVGIFSLVTCLYHSCADANLITLCLCTNNRDGGECMYSGAGGGGCRRDKTDVVSNIYHKKLLNFFWQKNESNRFEHHFTRQLKTLHLWSNSVLESRDRCCFKAPLPLSVHHLPIHILETKCLADPSNRGRAHFIDLHAYSSVALFISGMHSLTLTHVWLRCVMNIYEGYKNMQHLLL